VIHKKDVEWRITLKLLIPMEDSYLFRRKSFVYFMILIYSNMRGLPVIVPKGCTKKYLINTDRKYFGFVSTV